MMFKKANKLEEEEATIRHARETLQNLQDTQTESEQQNKSYEDTSDEQESDSDDSEELNPFDTDSKAWQKLSKWADTFDYSNTRDESFLSEVRRRVYAGIEEEETLGVVTEEHQNLHKETGANIVEEAATPNTSNPCERKDDSSSSKETEDCNIEVVFETAVSPTRRRLMQIAGWSLCIAALSKLLI